MLLEAYGLSGYRVPKNMITGYGFFSSSSFIRLKLRHFKRRSSIGGLN